MPGGSMDRGGKWRLFDDCLSKDQTTAQVVEPVSTDDERNVKAGDDQHVQNLRWHVTNGVTYRHAHVFQRGDIAAVKIVVIGAQYV